VAVRWEGRWVVDLWGGYADAARTRLWERDTLALAYSVTKPFAAVCALILAERGTLDLDEPATAYWPELTARTTVRQMLSHQSGLPLLETPVSESALYDWDLMCHLIAGQSPLWEPGSAFGESALLFGHQIGEVVRRVDGRRPGAFLRDEVCGRRGIDFHVGLGEAELARVADVTGFDHEFRRSVEEHGDLMMRALSNPPGPLDPTVVNGRPWRTADIAAANGHGTARGVAGLYVALSDGDLLQPETLEAMTSAEVSGIDRVLNMETAWGLGVAVDEDGFGMGGIGGSVGWCSTAGGYCFGFVTGLVAGHDRSDALENAFRSCLGLPPI
jgi:CubicO group peptidase (beta-lactamase class C family)